MLERTYSLTTHDITVAVTPQLLEQQSDPIENVYAYAYTVKIKNLSSDTVQLVERHWIVMSGDKQIAEVVGEGVVGEQPILEPGIEFEYTSSTVVNDPVGAMYGSYTFRANGGKFITVEIPKFDLFYPIMVH
jgi:ApaG protein